jgi:hypothetical protein
MSAVMGYGIALALGHGRHWKQKFASADDRQETDGNVPLLLNTSWIEKDECN